MLVVAGSPCQQLTTLGPQGGRSGVCGATSHLFYAVPALCGILQDLRPDLHINTLLENAGSMLDMHRDAILGGLNLAGCHALAPRVDAGDWAPVPRRRTLISTLPHLPIPSPRARPHPWDPGWYRWSRDPPPTMLRARSDPAEPIRASTYQYAPRHLLFQRNTRWDCIHPNQQPSAIRNLLPGATAGVELHCPGQPRGRARN